MADETGTARHTSRGVIGLPGVCVDAHRPHVRVRVHTDVAQALASDRREECGLSAGRHQFRDPLASSVVGEMRCRHTWRPWRPSANPITIKLARIE